MRRSLFGALVLAVAGLLLVACSGRAPSAERTTTRPDADPVSSASAAPSSPSSATAAPGAAGTGFCAQVPNAISVRTVTRIDGLPDTGSPTGDSSCTYQSTTSSDQYVAFTDVATAHCLVLAPGWRESDRDTDAIENPGFHQVQLKRPSGCWNVEVWSPSGSVDVDLDHAHLLLQLWGKTAE